MLVLSKDKRKEAYTSDPTRIVQDLAKEKVRVNLTRANVKEGRKRVRESGKKRRIL